MYARDVKRIILALTVGLALAAAAPSEAYIFNNDGSYAYIALNGNVVTPVPRQKALLEAKARGDYTVDPPPSEIISAYRRAIVRLQCAKGRNWGTLGTGFFVGPNRILTNYHVAGRALRITVLNADGVMLGEARVINDNSACDLVALEPSFSYTGPYVQFLPDSNYQPPCNITIMGYPGGRGFTVQSGTISSAKYDPSDREAQLFISQDLTTHEGMSGAPVVNEEGNCIGMLSSGSDQLSGIIPANVLSEALSMTNNDHPYGFSTGITVGLDYHNLYRFEEGPPSLPAHRAAGRYRRAGRS
jgi:S1-C subfamily serine protease